VLKTAGAPLLPSLARLLRLARAPERIFGDDESVLRQLSERGREERAIELLACRSLHALFEALDADCSNRLNFTELVRLTTALAAGGGGGGGAKGASGGGGGGQAGEAGSGRPPLADAAAAAARGLLRCDADGDRRLDRLEFAAFILEASEAAGEPPEALAARLAAALRVAAGRPPRTALLDVAPQVDQLLGDAA